MARSLAKEAILMLKDPQAHEKASRRGFLPGSANQFQPNPEEQQDMEEVMEALKNIFGN